MSFEKLLQKPEEYRIGPNYRATNIVFPVEFENQFYVVKKPRFFLASMIESYYVFQDKFFLGTRKKHHSLLRLESEARKLKALQGKKVPEFVAYRKGTLVREYLRGKDFRRLESDSEREQTLEGAIKALEEIHKEIALGDGHVKNTFLDKNNQIYWLDLEGLIDESDSIKVKAADILKFVYSTYAVTRDEGLTLYAAELVAKNYSKREVREKTKELAGQLEGGISLWFSTRLPVDGKLNKRIKRVIKG